MGQDLNRQIIGKPQKSNFLVARLLRGGGGGNAEQIRKRFFLKLEKNPIKNVATKLEAFVAGPLKK